MFLLKESLRLYTHVSSAHSPTWL